MPTLRAPSVSCVCWQALISSSCSARATCPMSAMHRLRPWLRPALNLPRDRTVRSRHLAEWTPRHSDPASRMHPRSSCLLAAPVAHRPSSITTTTSIITSLQGFSPRVAMPRYRSPAANFALCPPPWWAVARTRLRAAHSSMGETPLSHLIAVLPDDEKSAARGVNSALLCPLNSALGHTPLPRIAPPSPEAADAGRLDGRSPPSATAVSSILSPSILSACELEAEPLTACGPAASA